MKNDIYEKMEILANSAKYDVSCSSSGVETSYKKGELGATHTQVEFVTLLHLMEDAYRFLKFYLQIFVSMIINQK